MLNQNEKALSDFNRVLKTDHCFIPALYQRAFSHENMGNITLAIDDLTKCLIDDDDDQVFFNRGRLYLLNQKYNEAISDFNIALKEIQRIVKLSEIEDQLIENWKNMMMRFLILII